MSATPASNTPAPTIVVQTASRGVHRWFTWIGWIGFLICGLMVISQRAARQDYYNTSRGILERFHSGAPDAGDKVAVIRLQGVIVGGDGFVKQQIDRVREDPSVRAVVLRIDSPGGTVTGSDYLYHHLTQLRREKGLPLVVSMGAIAASGGYYAAMAVGDQERSIFAEPTTTTGSIGVIIPHYDLSGLLDNFHIKDDSIASNPRKQMLSLTREMSDEDRKIIQAYVNDAFDRFKDIVKSGRPLLRQHSPENQLLDAASGRDLATGEIFTANQARAMGLVDEIGYVEDAIDRAAELAGLAQGQYRVVEYARPATLLDMAGLPLSSATSGRSEALLDLAAPRAYYLATTLPVIFSSRYERL